jgi:membrane fusion protein (multidrug efflux system)
MGPRPQETVPVELGAVEHADMAAVYSTSGTLRAERRATVTSRTNGILERLQAEEGDVVRQGAPLAELDNDEQRIAAARAVDTYETRRRELERLERLFAQALVSEEAIEQARRDAQDAEHATDLARLELDRTIVKAPFTGVVVTRHLDVGNTVTSGTPVYTLADIDPLLLDVNVPERHVARLQPSQRVRLTPDAVAGSVDGVIDRIAPAVDPATGTVKVTLTVEGDSELRPGTFVRVDIITDTHEQALVVPRSALVSEGRRWYVYQAEDRTAHKVEVRLGYESEDRVEILPAGEVALGLGDVIVTAGAGALEEGSKIRLPGETPEPEETVAEGGDAAAAKAKGRAKAGRP